MADWWIIRTLTVESNRRAMRWDCAPKGVAIGAPEAIQVVISLPADPAEAVVADLIALCIAPHDPAPVFHPMPEGKVWKALGGAEGLDATAMADALNVACAMMEAA